MIALFNDLEVSRVDHDIDDGIGCDLNLILLRVEEYHAEVVDAISHKVR